MSVAVLENVGAVERLEVPEIPGGGIVVFTGKQGVGKSTAIRAVDSLLNGKSKSSLSTKDGEAFGSVEGWGARLTIGKQVRRSGEIEVAGLETRIDPAKLVNPGIQDPETADQHRIKALVSLANIKPDLSLFHEAFGSKALFDSVVQTSAVKSDDLVSMAAAIKRMAETNARTQEADADQLAGQAKAKYDKPADIDESAPCDEAKLSAAYDAAVRHEAALEATKEANDKTLADAENATERLQEIGDGSSLEECKSKLVAAEMANEKAVKALRAAEQAATKTKAELSAAKLAVVAAEQSEKQHQTLLDLIERAKSVKPISQDDLEAARAAKDTAKAASKAGQRLRDYLAAKAEGKRLSDKSIECRKLADRLREAAGATQDILSKAVQQAGIPELRVAAGRLVTKTKRGTTLFGELSEGERWRIALDIAIRQVGKGGVFAIPQEAWDAVDVFNRDAINEQVKAAGVTIVTAETLQDRKSKGAVGVRIYA